MRGRHALRDGHARRARVHVVGRLRPAHLNFVGRVRIARPSAWRGALPSATAGTETRASRWPTPACSAPARRRSRSLPARWARAACRCPAAPAPAAPAGNRSARAPPRTAGRSRRREKLDAVAQCCQPASAAAFARRPLAQVAVACARRIVCARVAVPPSSPPAHRRHRAAACPLPSPRRTCGHTYASRPSAHPALLEHQLVAPAKPLPVGDVAHVAADLPVRPQIKSHAGQQLLHVIILLDQRQPLPTPPCAVVMSASISVDCG